MMTRFLLFHQLTDTTCVLNELSQIQGRVLSCEDQ